MESHTLAKAPPPLYLFAWYFSALCCEIKLIHIGVARIFSGGEGDTPHTATNYLFVSSAGVYLTRFSPIFASFQQNAYKNFFVALATPTLIHTSKTAVLGGSLFEARRVN